VLHEFASKVIVIRDVALNDDAITAKVEAFVSEHGATSPSQLARGVGISVTLAKEQLLTAEGSGVLCRDDTIDCMRFYPNRFVSEAAR
jgi:ESCRT-II complex subunit VPS36